jgi:hypothetical protein
MILRSGVAETGRAEVLEGFQLTALDLVDHVLDGLGAYETTTPAEAQVAIA